MDDPAKISAISGSNKKARRAASDNESNEESSSSEDSESNDESSEAEESEQPAAKSCGDVPKSSTSAVDKDARKDDVKEKKTPIESVKRAARGSTVYIPIKRDAEIQVGDSNIK